MIMKDILFIAPVDMNQRFGGALAMLSYYNALNYLFPDKVEVLMPQEACVGRFQQALKAPKRNLLNAVFSGSIHRYKSVLKNHLQSYSSYKWCVINGGIYAGDMMDMIKSYGIKTVVIHHNFETEYQMDNKTLWTLKGITPYWIMRNERNAYLKADVNCFLTKDDICLFQNAYGDSLGRKILLGVFEPYTMAEQKLQFMEKSCCVITGSLDAYQTIIGLKSFRNEYWHIYKNITKNLRLIIAGRNPSKEIMEFAEQNQDMISLIPNPVDMDQIVGGARIFICPTNTGGGLKLRVMDGLRMGVPILVHSVSARGYDYYAALPFFKVYHDPITFRDGLNDLIEYTKKNHRQEIYNKYLEYFSFESGCKRIVEIFKSEI